MPYIKVLMVKNNPTEYPEYNLPSGYSYTYYKKGYEEDWAKLQVVLKQIDTIEEALNYFNNEFLVSKNELYKKALFVKDCTGNIIATASLWEGNHFGDIYQRVHWVAVDADHQGKGIAKALLTEIFGIFNKLDYEDFVYLITQTWSYRAINIYLKFDFEPYKGPKPENWPGTDEEFIRKNELAWKLIMEQINEYNN